MNNQNTPKNSCMTDFLLFPRNVSVVDITLQFHEDPNTSKLLQKTMYKY